MTRLLLVLALTIPVVLSAQDDYYPKLTERIFEAIKAKQFENVIPLGKELYAAYPDNIDAHIAVGYAYICLGRPKEGESYIASTMAIDPSEFNSYLLHGLYFVAVGNNESAKEYLSQGIRLWRPGIIHAEVIDDLRSVAGWNGRSATIEELVRWYQKQVATDQVRYPTTDSLARLVVRELEKGPGGVGAIADNFAAKFYQLSWPDMALRSYAACSKMLRESAHYSEALDVAERGYTTYTSKGYGNNSFQAAFLLEQLIASYEALGNSERVVEYMDEVLALTDKLPLHTSDVRALVSGSSAYNVLGNNDKARELAGEAWQLAAVKATNRFDGISAANALCAAYNYFRFPDDVNNAIYYGQQAMQMGITYKFETLLGSIIGNLGLAYWKLGTAEGQGLCLQIHGQLRAIYEQKEMWADAALTLNNVGAMYAWSGMWSDAAELFEQSIALTQRGTVELSDEDKLTYYQARVSAYEFLTMCYANLKNAEKTFDAMEGMRSRVLTERLARGTGQNATGAKMSELQEMLQPDEAAIMYHLFSAHEVVILVVTKKYSQAIFHTDDSFIGVIKEKYLDRMNKEHRDRGGQEEIVPVTRGYRVVKSDFDKVTQLTRRFFERPGMADDVLKEYLQGFYKFLILPISNRLTGIKSLIIAPDNVLNYIPFEALTLHDGKYLVEKYNVRYMNSTGVMRQIASRQYEPTREPLLAMGGAVYEPLKIAQPSLRTQHDLNMLRAEVNANEKSGGSQLKSYAAIFGTDAMNPLPGTVQEVKAISQSVPAATVFYGRDMSESRLKQLSKDGGLTRYKVLHLATHGFVVEDIPVLSGIAMSIPGVVQNGEDGFMNTNEIAGLKLNADLAVLSACQTALGKIYSGEGVTGLTQSLLVAGANAALVSLWPVNDTSTMLFMSNMYKEAAKGKSYAQIVNELKRKFIKGDFGAEFKHPNFWAPFVYIGK